MRHLKTQMTLNWRMSLLQEQIQKLVVVVEGQVALQHIMPLQATVWSREQQR